MAAINRHAVCNLCRIMKSISSLFNPQRSLPVFVFALLSLSVSSATVAQDQPPEKSSSGESLTAESPTSPDEVNVVEVVDDYQIDARLQQILESTEWFQEAGVEVKNGVVFLTGSTEDEKYRSWAGNLAERTEDVVAVVNRITVTEALMLDLKPAWFAASDMLRSSIRAIPMLLLTVALLILTWLTGIGTQKLADWTILKRVQSKLLREVGRKAVVIPVFIVGVFLVLRVTGLSQLAMTVLGGTGLFGLVIGIAFRDIAENFLSSILLSIQNPFRYGDLIEVDKHLGYVQRVNTRGTLLMTQEGNHVQIPNSTIFKGTIINYTSNPNRRFSFDIGIGYDASASSAQESAMSILSGHPAILQDPEPQVLVERLASSTINLTVYAWVDAAEHSWTKVRSSVIRLTLRAFEEAGFSMPDDQREIVFPNGVPVQMLDETPKPPPEPKNTQTSKICPEAPAEAVSNVAEGDFRSEAFELQEQAKQSRDPDEAMTDLLAEHPEQSAQQKAIAQ